MKQIFSLFFIFQIYFSFGQEFSFKSEYEVSDKRIIQNYFAFEGIKYSQNIISGNSIVKKNYIINLKEYSDGKLVSTTCLDKSNNQYYAIIDSVNFNFNILGKLEKNSFSIQLFFPRYSTRKFDFKLQSKYAKDYILKEMPINQEDLKINRPFIFLLLTPPKFHNDGSASWCEVAANETPDKIYEKSKIPHFFVFEMTIME